MIRKIKREDKDIYMEMAKQFYASDAVYQDVPKQHLIDAFEEMLNSNLYMDGYLIEHDNIAAGYAIVTKTYSQEAGGMVWWIDEIFVLPKYRSHGLGREFFNYLSNHLDARVKRLRLEVDADNEKAIAFYEKLGFAPLPYDQMATFGECKLKV